MKIITVVRTLNEERNIGRFCRGYDFSDLILVGDGGSTDDTLKIALQFPNVRVATFEQRRYLTKDFFMNPEPAHHNFLVKWAELEDADWIIRDDCDSWPNPKLHREARKFIELADTIGKDGVFLHRLYMWYEDAYFPSMNKGGHAVWAYRASLKYRADESKDTFFDAMVPAPAKADSLLLDPPYVCLHYFAPARHKEIRYELWGRTQHPMQSTPHWPPKPLPDWVMEE